VSLPGGAQAEDKTQSAGRKLGLVRVRDDGRIEQGCRFQGEFANEIGTDQQLSLFGNFLIGQYEVADLFEPFQKGSVDFLVSSREFSGYFLQKRPHLALRERHDSGDNSASSLGSLRSERAQKNAGLVRSEDRARALDICRSSDHELAIPENCDEKLRLLKTTIISEIAGALRDPDWDYWSALGETPHPDSVGIGPRAVFPRISCMPVDGIAGRLLTTRTETMTGGAHTHEHWVSCYQSVPMLVV
jgi:hypothetical protein